MKAKSPLIKVLVKSDIPLFKSLLACLIPSALKIFMYRMKGYKIGKHVKIGLGSTIHGQSVFIEDSVHIGIFCRVQAREIYIGQESSIASFCFLDTIKLKIGKQTRIRQFVRAGGLKTPDSALEIGDKCIISNSTLFNPTMKIQIGDNSGIGGECKLFTHSSWLSVMQGYPAVMGPIIIGKNVSIPYSTMILTNVTIGDHVIVTPPAVINMDIPSYTFAGGYPLKIRKNALYRELSLEKKEKILKEILVEFENMLQFDGFQKIEIPSLNSAIFQNDKIKLLLADHLVDALQSIEKDMINSGAIVLTSFEIPEKQKMQLPGKKFSIVYLENDIPVVVNKNQSAIYWLEFLSRFGLR
jgi:acetyltransferase-like isoleucine patch superfamily enzyme